MSRLEATAYDKELNRVAKNLNLSTKGDVEKTILDYCLGRVHDWIAAHGQPKTLSELLHLFAVSLDLEFTEIHDDAEFDDLLKRYPPQLEPVMACIPTELDDKTDGITIKRSSCQPGDRSLLAVVNCRNWHGLRAFFTKWHEAVHCILEGQQLRMAMRHTRAKRPDAEEVLVDKIAGVLAFYPPIFQPVIERELSSTGTIGFGGIDHVRQLVAPEASFTATVIASLRYCKQPVWFLTCGLGYKRELEKTLSRKQGRLLPLPEPQLRLRDVRCNQAAINKGIRLYTNMRVPEQSIVNRAFYEGWLSTEEGIDRLEAWETSSSGPVGYGQIEVEAFRRDDEVWALLRLLDD